MNQGLHLISPIILTRLLSVADFGRYREFLLYATLMTGVAAFGINSSLLRFIPVRPELGWRYVNQSVLMTLGMSTMVGVAVLVLNALTDGRLVGEYAVPVVFYVLLFVNFDFWEFLWIAEKRPMRVWSYTTGRLAARITVVTVAAALTQDVSVIINSLIGLELVRVVVSIAAWRSRNRTHSHVADDGSWREQLGYCVPFGTSLMVVVLNRSMGSLFVAKMMGPIALAHYAIGTYVQPIVSVLRNSLSDVMLGELAASSRDTNPDRLLLWRRSTVVTAILLVCAGVILARFAEVFVLTLFGAEYQEAVIVFQLFLLVLLREAMDFAVPLRAINRTTPILRSNLVAIAVNAALLALLLPLWGLPGAVVAYLVSRIVEGSYMASQLLRAYDISLRQLAEWGDLLKIGIAAALASVVLYGSFWTETMGLFGVLIAAAFYVAAFGGLLWLLRVPEMTVLLRHLRGYSRSLLARFQS
jgi:O-antigen/teichoic acid export membrane protein